MASQLPERPEGVFPKSLSTKFTTCMSIPKQKWKQSNKFFQKLHQCLEITKENKLRKKRHIGVGPKATGSHRR